MLSQTGFMTLLLSGINCELNCTIAIWWEEKSYAWTSQQALRIALHISASALHRSEDCIACLHDCIAPLPEVCPCWGYPGSTG